MLINEVCQICSLTKKAVEYYIQQGLVVPEVQGNGYREFSDMQVARLKKISVLRNLGLSVSDIQAVLSDQKNAYLEQRSEEYARESVGNSALYAILEQKHMEITVMQEKQRLLAELARNQNWDEVQDKLGNLQKKQTVLERLRNAFPGCYGDFACAHFAPYLSESIHTQEQQEAYDTIIAFLDNAHLVIPDDLQEYYNAVQAEFAEFDFERMSAGVCSAVSDIENFMDKNREAIAHYMECTQTEGYKATPMYRMAEILRQFNRESGYDDIFIPAMCCLSNSYRAYWEALQSANEKLLERYPDWAARTISK
ncbi:MAG: MerR family transcriptional regulator [Lachnospiraceae bacterium]|nr:MerR family transcriptional regulator [Lachnospiraceae bacterium]